MELRVESSVQFAGVIAAALLAATTARAGIYNLSWGAVDILTVANVLEKNVELPTGQARPISYSPEFTVVPDALPFSALLKKWKEERGATSSITKMAMCPAHQQIIAMGPRIIPLILHQMESEGNEPDMWFWALRLLSNTDPVSEADRGNITRMAQAWLTWGRTQYAG